MFLQFFTSLRDAQVPVTLREYLTLMEAIDADLAEHSVENFYYLARTALVKDGVMYVQAGGGVVADSVPEAEYQETVAKAAALMRAAEEAVRFATAGKRGQ